MRYMLRGLLVIATSAATLMGLTPAAAWAAESDSMQAARPANIALASSGGDVWDNIARCESSGRWNANTGNGYFGGLQFARTTWNSFGGRQYAPMAHQASREQQIAVARKVLRAQGWQAWPTCSRRAGLR